MTEADKTVSHITKQVSGKKIQISLHRLLEIVKPEIQRDIINSIVNPDIAKQRCVISVKKKKRIHNYSTSESSSSSSSSSSSGSDSESSNDDKDFTMDVVGESHYSAIKAKKRD